MLEGWFLLPRFPDNDSPGFQVRAFPAVPGDAWAEIYMHVTHMVCHGTMAPPNGFLWERLDPASAHSPEPILPPPVPIICKETLAEAVQGQ